MKKLLKAKLIILATGIVAILLSIFLAIVFFVSLFSAIATSHAKRANDCGPTKSKATESTVATSPADQTIDSFIKEHEEAYILSWKAGGYLPSFSIAQTFVEYGFNFTNPSGTSFWQAHNMGGVKTGGNITNFPITLATYGQDAVDLSGTRLGTNVGDNTGGNYAWFKSYDAGIVAKSEFMAHQTLYKGAINNTEPRAISKAIAQGGWASDPSAYENSLNNAYDSVGANYKWLDEKAIKKYGNSPFVETGPVQPSDSLGVTAKPKTRNKCGKRNNPTGWVEHSGECVDLTVSLGNILWGHSGTVFGDGKYQSGEWAKIFGNSTTSKARKGSIFSSSENATYGHTGIVCHVFEDESFLVVEQNYSVSGNAIGKKNTYSYRLISKAASERNGFSFAYGNESNLNLTNKKQ